MNLTHAYLVRCLIQIVIILLILSKVICWTWYYPNQDIYYDYYRWNYYPKTITPSVFQKKTNNSVHILIMLYLVTFQSSIILLLFHYKIRRDNDSRCSSDVHTHYTSKLSTFFLRGSIQFLFEYITNKWFDNYSELDYLSHLNVINNCLIACVKPTSNMC